MKPIVILHGGAANVSDSVIESKLRGIKEAVKAGYKVLLNGDSALEAVEEAVAHMEADKTFNAGYGSVLNLGGEIEMEASVMRGSDLKFGGVSLVKNYQHPIKIASKILTETPYGNILGGTGVELFALTQGFEPVLPESLISENARQGLQRFINHKEQSKMEVKSDENNLGPVGAVAVDSNGHLAAAASSGGMYGKPVGRIGGTPLIGCSIYADDKIGGVSMTGHGESMMKCCMAYSIIKLIEGGLDANAATTEVVEGMYSRLNNVSGAITLTPSGDVCVQFTSKRMPWAYIKDDVIYYGVDKGQILKEDYKTNLNNKFSLFPL